MDAALLAWLFGRGTDAERIRLSTSSFMGQIYDELDRGKSVATI
jgi:hypothetical protein